LEDLPGSLAGAAGDAFAFFLSADEGLMMEGFQRGLLAIIVGRR
jgi:hypothetical protein